MRMKQFQHRDMKSLPKAVSVLTKYKEKAMPIAGGTDLLGVLKDNIHPEQPSLLVNIKTISDLTYIKEDETGLKIGSLTKLCDIERNQIINTKYKMLAESARTVASPQIRNMGTIAGNICQEPRCWYYRNPGNMFNCIRKGGKTCNALTGENQYHSIFGAARVADVPCSVACPGGIEIPYYLHMIREGNLFEAAQILLRYNPMPAITGRVCPHFCEQECNRDELDQSVSIRAIERYIGDYILDNTNKFFRPPEKERGKSIAIVGAGPAGLSAAYYLRGLGYSVSIFEMMEEAGGLLTYGIPPYRLPKDVVRRQLKALEGIGIDFKLKYFVDENTTIKLMKRFDAIFLACGAWKESLVGVEGEGLMISGLEFLRNYNRWFRELPGKEVAVIGGGNAAVDVARTLMRLGAEPIIIYRRSKVEMPAVKEEVEKAEEEGIKIRFLTQPVTASKKGDKIDLKCIKMKFGPLDETGRATPVPIAGSEFHFEFDAVMKAIGEKPDTSAIPGEFLDKNKRLKVGVSTYSLGKNVFAGGDFVTGPTTVIAAIAAGRRVAKSINSQLLPKVTTFYDSQENTQQPLVKFNSNYLVKTKRIDAPELPVPERRIGTEDSLGVDFAQVEQEANRCFNCGCVAVIPSDIAPTLVALGAKIKTTRRTIDAESFFAAKLQKSTILDTGELVTEIHIPPPQLNNQQLYTKFRIRKSIDFPIVSVSAVFSMKLDRIDKARIVLGAVAPIPVRATEVEQFLKGRKLNKRVAEVAASIGVKATIPLAMNKYKIQVTKSLIRRVIQDAWLQFRYKSRD